MSLENAKMLFDHDAWATSPCSKRSRVFPRKSYDAPTSSFVRANDVTPRLSPLWSGVFIEPCQVGGASAIDREDDELGNVVRVELAEG